MSRSDPDADIAAGDYSSTPGDVGSDSADSTPQQELFREGDWTYTIYHGTGCLDADDTSSSNSTNTGRQLSDRPSQEQDIPRLLCGPDKHVRGNAELVNQNTTSYADASQVSGGLGAAPPNGWRSGSEKKSV